MHSDSQPGTGSSRFAPAAHYRREIDGLRAVAVLPVMFFHSGFQAFSGGFVGVDVFFVISGYLITRLIFSDLSLGTFSVVKFYERRARRILPALFLVMCTCLPFAWLWLLPADMKGFSESLIAVPLFASNFLFRHRSGYFDSATELQPLLHTWSLAVEEQYYLIFPFFLKMTYGLGKRRVLGLLGVTFMASLMMAQWGTTARPTATFYYLPTRGWEILAGALVGLWGKEPRGLAAGQTPWRNHTRLSWSQLSFEAGGIVGLSMISYAVFAFNDRTAVPGLPALTPTLGAALVILCSNPSTIVGGLLGSGPLVGIGQMSYSAYLWHQPVLAFARYRTVDGTINGGLLLVISLLLAYLSWRYVEAPFRDAKRFSRKQIFATGALASLCFIGVGACGIGGFPARFSSEQRDLLSAAAVDFRTNLAAYGLGKCFIDYDQTVEVLLKNDCAHLGFRGRRVIVFGDSEAAHWIPGVNRELAKLGFRVGQWTATSCRAVRYAGSSRRCEDFYNRFVSDVVPSLSSSDLVIVSSRWIDLLERPGALALTDSLDTLLGSLRSSGARVVVIGNTPEFGRAPQHLMLLQGTKNEGSVFLRSSDFREVNRLLEGEAEEGGAVFVNPSTVLCDALDALRCKVAAEGVWYFFDAGHLSPEGSIHVFERMVSRLGFPGMSSASGQR